MAVDIATRLQYAYDAGFRNTNAVESLSIIVAISLAECGVGSSTGCENGCNPDAGGTSCGIVQCFSIHPWYLECQDPRSAMAHAYGLSGGTAFGAWSTYNGGQYAPHLAEVRAVLAALPPPVGTAAGPPPPPPPPHHPPPPPPQPTSTNHAMAAVLVAAGLAGAAIFEMRHPKDRVKLAHALHHVLHGSREQGGRGGRTGSVRVRAVTHRTGHRGV